MTLAKETAFTKAKRQERAGHGRGTEKRHHFGCSSVSDNRVMKDKMGGRKATS